MQAQFIALLVRGSFRKGKSGIEVTERGGRVAQRHNPCVSGRCGAPYLALLGRL